jgi:hypothetical protein
MWHRILGNPVTPSQFFSPSSFCRSRPSTFAAFSLELRCNMATSGTWDLFRVDRSVTENFRLCSINFKFPSVAQLLFRSFVCTMHHLQLRKNPTDWQIHFIKSGRLSVEPTDFSCKLRTYKIRRILSIVRRTNLVPWDIPWYSVCPPESPWDFSCKWRTFRGTY